MDNNIIYVFSTFFCENDILIKILEKKNESVLKFNAQPFTGVIAFGR